MPHTELGHCTKNDQFTTSQHAGNEDSGAGQTKVGPQLSLHVVEKRSATLCLEFPNINAVAEWNSYLIPKVDQCTFSLRDELISSSLQANDGYRRVQIKYTYSKRTALTLYHQLYCYSVRALYFPAPRASSNQP